jgi:hypothetical protein
VRQAGVVLLCVIAPLAFAMAMLPNTQFLFKKWWSMLSKLLIIYPIIGLIFGASYLAGDILIVQGDEIMKQMNNHDIGSPGWMMQLAGSACQVIPLFAVPVVLKGSLKGLGALGAAIGGFAAGRMSAASGRLKGRVKSGFQDSSARSWGLRGKGWVASNLANSKLGQSRFGRHIVGSRNMQRTAAVGAAEADRRDKEMMDLADAQVSDYSVSDMLDAAKYGAVGGQFDASTGLYSGGRKLNNFQQRAAIIRVKTLMNDADIMQLAKQSDRSKVRNKKVRSTMASAVAENLAKVPWWGGRQLANIENGTPNEGAAALDWLDKNKASGGALASMGPNAIDTLHKNALASDNPEYMAKLKSAASSITADQWVSTTQANKDTINQILGRPDGTTAAPSSGSSHAGSTTGTQAEKDSSSAIPPRSTTSAGSANAGVAGAATPATHGGPSPVILPGGGAGDGGVSSGIAEVGGVGNYPISAAPDRPNTSNGGSPPNSSTAAPSSNTDSGLDVPHEPPPVPPPA